MGLPWLKGAICLLHKDGKTLFVDYRDFPHKILEGTYAPPGGTYEEKDNSTFNTIIREIKEEVNIPISNPIYRGRVHFDNEKRTVRGKPMKINMGVDIFECYNVDDSKAMALEEKEGKTPKLAWFKDEEIEGIKEMHESDRKMFEWLRMYKEFEGTISQIGETLGEFSLKYTINN